MSLPFVSIITVTHNRANLLHRCIDSIQNQTYNNFEHIIIDGNSTDNTYGVVSSYKDKRINYFKSECNDVYYNNKWAIDLAKGKYITFLDDDDEYLSSKIEKQVSVIEQLSSEYGMIYCWMDYYDNISKQYLHTHKTELKDCIGDIVIEKPLVSGTPTLMIRKEVFNVVGYFYRNDIGILSDWEFCVRVCQKYKIDYVPESLVKVYVNHGSQRISEVGYYQNGLNKTIIFHTHFLKEFSDVFEKYPARQHFHLEMLFRAYCQLGQWQRGLSYYMKLIKVHFTVRDCALLPYLLLQRIKIKWIK